MDEVSSEAVHSNVRELTENVDQIKIALTDIEMATIPITKPDDPYLVTFDDHFDAENPK